jgi:membrane-associated phospholipid phosphatase
LTARSLRAALLCLVIGTGAAMQAQVQDTINKKTQLLVGKDALLLGVFAVGAAAVAPIDKQIASRLQDSSTQENRFLHYLATGFRLLGDPGSAVTGAVTYGIGRINGQRRVQALGLHTVEAILFANMVTGAVKYVAGRQRPLVDVTNPYDFQLWRGFKGDTYRSFPSGHSTTAFAFASALTRESQFWWPHAGFYVGTVFYSGAALVGASRMYNNMHWASDVMSGAAIGTIIGLKVVKYTHSHPDNAIDKKLIKGKKSQIQVNPVLFSIRF